MLRFGLAALASGILLLLTLLFLVQVVLGGTDLGPLPVMAGFGASLLGRAAWRLRPR